MAIYRNFGEKMTPFVQALFLRRKELRMSQAELASASGVSRNYISQIERGNIDNVSIGVFFKICFALRMNMSVSAVAYESFGDFPERATEQHAQAENKTCRANHEKLQAMRLCPKYCPECGGLLR
jgi:transcriptional regulator with XRE-family HTH domain